MTAGRARDANEARVTPTAAPQERSAQTWQTKGDPRAVVLSLYHSRAVLFTGGFLSCSTYRGAVQIKTVPPVAYCFI